MNPIAEFIKEKEKEFSKQFDGELWVKEHDSGGDDTSAPSSDYIELKSFLHQFALELVKLNDKQMEQNIGMLRQWLNEDRIKDADRFVTNEQLKMWLLERSKLKNIRGGIK